ncbi:PhzF family phenazine biosynthesis protein [bacterium]|nr:PhzF family phenazine biosynthesis protein [bacterium]
MGQSIIQVDAFADRPFRGNPAAVCVMNGPGDERWMQSVAMEMNLSETAFVHPVDGGFSIRWFTPAVEVELCGHATLASAYVLYADKHVPADQRITFHSKSGPLHAVRNGDLVSLDFPGSRTELMEPIPEVVEALRVKPVAFGKTRFDYLIELTSETEVRACAPDFNLLTKARVRGVMITARGGGEHDFVSRFFAPGAGIAEDPVTGSAHCSLAPYWAERLKKDTMLAYQASRRGGTIRVTVAGDRVHLAGKAVVTMRGELQV